MVAEGQPTPQTHSGQCVHPMGTGKRGPSMLATKTRTWWALLTVIILLGGPFQRSPGWWFSDLGRGSDILRHLEGSGFS